MVEKIPFPCDQRTTHRVIRNLAAAPVPVKSDPRAVAPGPPPGPLGICVDGRAGVKALE